MSLDLSNPEDSRSHEVSGKCLPARLPNHNLCVKSVACRGNSRATTGGNNNAKKEVRTLHCLYEQALPRRAYDLPSAMKRQHIEDWIDRIGLHGHEEEEEEETEATATHDRIRYGRKHQAYPTPEPPTKRIKIGAPPSNIADVDMSQVLEPDTEATPRAPARRPLVDDDHRFFQSPQSPSISSHSSATTKSSAKRSRTSRPASPTKRALLRTIPHSVRVEEYPKPKIPEKAPLNFKKLVDGILDFQIGLNTAPVALQAELRNSEERAFRRDDVFYAPSNPRAQLGSSPTIAEIDRIIRKANEFEGTTDSEAAWNCFVHGPILALAEDYSTHSSHVSVKNV
jgi:hypothetical protein